MPYDLKITTMDKKEIKYTIQELKELKIILEEYKNQTIEVDLKKIKVKK